MSHIIQQDFLFTDKRLSVNSNVFYARMTEHIYSKDQLLDSLYYMLWFPSYYGMNFDALNDCINDLTWLNENYIILHHKHLPNINDEDLSIYIDILIYAVLTNYDDKNIYVVFSNKCYQKIQDIKKHYLQNTVKKFNISSDAKYISQYYAKLFKNTDFF